MSGMTGHLHNQYWQVSRETLDQMVAESAFRPPDFSLMPLRNEPLDGNQFLVP